MKMRAITVVLMSIALLGCASTVPVASPAADARAKQFAAPVGKSMIYVVRSPGRYGSAILFQVGLDGKPLGGIASKTYFAVAVDPGDHVVTASGSENQDELRLTTEPDKLYFVRVNVKSGLMSGRVDLEHATDVVGRDFIQRSSLASTFGQ